MSQTSVLLVLEGTYPFHSGGVSTWAHMLCNKISGVDFTLYSMNAQYEKIPLYDLGSNIKKLIQVPIWSAYETIDFLDFGEEYRISIEKKESTLHHSNLKAFVPLFKDLLKCVYTEDAKVLNLNEILVGFWKYFECYDFKETMKSACVWNAYREVISAYVDKDILEKTSLADLKLGMQWLYRFLIPFSYTDLPKTSIVHLSLAGFAVIPALICKNKYDTKIVLTEHGLYIRERLLYISKSGYSFFLKKLLIQFTQAMTKLSYHLSDSIVSVNSFNQRWELMFGADSSKLRVIYNGIDGDHFVPGEKPEDLKYIPTVVAAARIFDLKDIETMIRSCAIVKEKIPNVRYLIYGDYKSAPKYTEQCKALITDLGLEHDFILKGRTSTPEKAFLDGDISILTSISEGFPYTVLESMSCGIPVVATDVGGVHEALTTDCGILCKPRDAQAIGNAVIYLLEKHQVRKEMGIRCRERILSHFTIEKFVSEYKELYNDLLNEKSTKSLYYHIPQKNDTTRRSHFQTDRKYQKAKRANG